jgi:hypothetical protein
VIRAVVVWIVVVAASSARADVEVAVSPGTCRVSPWSEDAWVKLLGVELSGDGIRVDQAVRRDAGVIRVSVDPNQCDEASTWAKLSCAVGDVQRARAIDLGDVAPIARPRVVAMAAAELVRSCNVAVHVSAPGPVVVAEQHLAVVEPPRRSSLSFDATGEARMFAHESTVLFGPRVGVAKRALGLLLSADGGVLFGRTHDPLGQIDGTVATVAASVLATTRIDGVVLGVGPRGEAGIGWFRGQAAMPTISESARTSPLAFVAVTGELWFHLAGSLTAAININAGTSLRGFTAQADNRRVFSVDGPMMSAGIGLAWLANER